MALRAVLVIASVAALDLLIKESIDTEPEENFPRKRGTIEIRRHRNPGFALGWLQSYPKLIKAVPAALSVLLGIGLGARIIQGERKHMLGRLGLSLALGGAVSNLVDRFRKGYVVDYLYLKAGIFRKIIFNLGDAAIAVGLLLSQL